MSHHRLCFSAVTQVVYLEKVVGGILLQVSIQERLDRLQQAAEAEAHEERMISVPVFHYCRQFNAHVLLEELDR